MGNENDLIQKLMISKKIMEKHNNMPRANNSGSYNIPTSPEVESFTPPQVNYNIPQEFLMESKQPQPLIQKGSPKDRILASKLPDEIKQLMIEHPIIQPDATKNTIISNDIIEKATRLMNVDASGKQTKTYSQPVQNQIQPNVDPNSIRQIVRETIEEVLSENGLLIESVNKTNDVFSFRVGQHIFEGKVTKIKKIK